MAVTRFTKEALLVTIEDNYNRAKLIAEAEFLREHSRTPSERRALWRSKESKRVIELATRLQQHAGDPDHDDYVPDFELSGFSTKHEPWAYDDDRHRADHKSAMIALEAAKSKALAYARALAEVEPGVVEVSAADLRRIGYEASA